MAPSSSDVEPEKQTLGFEAGRWSESGAPAAVFRGIVYTVNVINLFNIYLLDSFIGMRSRGNPRIQVLGILSESKA